MAPHRARIVLADQQVLFRQSLAHVLTSGGHTVVCQVGDGDALDRCMIENEPEIWWEIIVEDSSRTFQVLGLSNNESWLNDTINEMRHTVRHGSNSSHDLFAYPKQ